MGRDIDSKKEVLLFVQGLGVGFPGQPAILPPISFEIHPSQVTTIVGHNGAGKSTLLKTLLGLQPKLSGELRLLPQVRLGYVPQREMMDPIYPIQVGELVETGKFGLRGVGRFLNPEDHEQIEAAMESAGVFKLRHRLFRTLSGGEQQRALLARALCTDPSILILDEPTASLDEKGAMDVMELTLNLARRKNAAILMVNHFIDLVAQISDQVIVLDRDHQVVQVGAPGEVLQNRGRSHGR